MWNGTGYGMVRDVDCGCVMWNTCFVMWCEMVVPRPTAV